MRPRSSAPRFTGPDPAFWYRGEAHRAGLDVIHCPHDVPARPSGARWILPRFDKVSSISAPMPAKLTELGIPAERIFELRNWGELSRVRRHALLKSRGLELPVSVE